MALATCGAASGGDACKCAWRDPGLDLQQILVSALDGLGPPTQPPHRQLNLHTSQSWPYRAAAGTCGLLCWPAAALSATALRPSCMVPGPAVGSLTAQFNPPMLPLAWASRKNNNRSFKSWARSLHAPREALHTDALFCGRKRGSRYPRSHLDQHGRSPPVQSGAGLLHCYCKKAIPQIPMRVFTSSKTSQNRSIGAP